MTEPPPVRLLAVADVRVCAVESVVSLLDDFYLGVLGLEREIGEPGQIVYKAENFRLRFDVLESPRIPEDLRPILIDVPSLSFVRQQLTDREIEFQCQTGLPPAQETLLLQDPAGNWVQIGQFSRI